MGYDNLVEVCRSLDMEEHAAEKGYKNPEEITMMNSIMSASDLMDVNPQYKITEEGWKVNLLLILKMLNVFNLSGKLRSNNSTPITC